MSQSTTVTGQNQNENPPKPADVRTEPIDPAWLMALPHLLGAFSLITAYLGFLLPLFVWLAKKDEDAAITAECRKVLRFQGAYLIFTLIFSLAFQISMPFAITNPQVVMAQEISGHASIFLGVLVFGLSLVAGYKVFNKREAKYPLGFDLVGLFVDKRSSQRG